MSTDHDIVMWASTWRAACRFAMKLQWAAIDKKYSNVDCNVTGQMPHATEWGKSD